MLFWIIVVFFLGLLGLVHEAFLINYGIPLFAEATSVCLMLVALGMLFSYNKQCKGKSKK
jgi:hypothetical protein